MTEANTHEIGYAMEISNIFGIPAHPLIVHAVVVLGPLAALGAIAVVVSSWVRSHIGWLVAATAVLNVLLVPLATGSGESLEERIDETALVETHAEMGEQLLPWIIALALVVVAFMVLARLASRRPSDTPPPVWASRNVSIVVAALTVIAASGALVQVARIGHSGAKASWSDVSSAARPGQPFIDGATVRVRTAVSRSPSLSPRERPGSS